MRKPKRKKLSLFTKPKKQLPEQLLQEETPSEVTELTGNLSETEQYIRQATGGSTDFIYKQFSIGLCETQQAMLIYIDGLVDTQATRDLLTYLMDPIRLQQETSEFGRLLDGHLLPISIAKEVFTLQDTLAAILAGQTVLLGEGFRNGLAIDASGAEHRNVETAKNQIVVKGPQDAFNEILRVNTALVRKRIKHPNLWTETMEIGEVTKTTVCVMYIKHLANEQIITEVKNRLSQIKTDSILETGYIEEFIEEKKWSLFPTMFNTERPDVVAANLLEGKVAIFVDNTPFVLSVPAVFVQFFQSAEDYYNRNDYGLLRILRFFSFFIALLAPALYIALTTFHQEMLQTTLLISIAAQRDAIPFPAFFEALIMQITFEILREAGIRMPRAVGGAISIVGALVLGESAVQAGLVSAAMVIVVAITALTTFIIPEPALYLPQRILRIVFMALGAFYGVFGIVIGLFALLLHLCSLESFGIPYMSPMGPLDVRDQQDTFIRLPRWMMKKRPKTFKSENEVRTNKK
ncbi:spore germination protein [Ectobacillus polymachus]|uniref:spore germination protein n=1 Tax=Ectobacillus polymachus TaxID=1508806 RepID=UPI003A875AC5